MENKSSTQIGKELLAYLRSKGLTDYGSVIPALEIHGVIGVEYPEVGTHEEFKDIDLRMLSVTDYVRNILLDEGKAFTQYKGDYKILLPSENAKYIESYMNSADKKLKRALKLSKNQPINESKNNELESARIVMKRQSIINEKQKQKKIRE